MGHVTHLGSVALAVLRYLDSDLGRDTCPHTRRLLECLVETMTAEWWGHGDVHELRLGLDRLHAERPMLRPLCAAKNWKPHVIWFVAPAPR